jgi:preprotein translocase subunit SecG
VGQLLVDIEIIIAILLIVSILLQHQGTSLGGTFGGEGNFYRSRRGVEKALFYFTIILASLFAVVALIKIVVK